MRLLLIVLIMFGTLIGLPRLAAVFRTDGPAVVRDAQTISPSNSSMDAQKTALVTAKVQDSVVPPVPSPATDSAASSPKPAEGPPAQIALPPAPANEVELIAAIERELSRLGLYEGPISPRWTGRARAAARRFAALGGGADYRRPTFGLLAALRAFGSPGAKDARPLASKSLSDEATARRSRTALALQGPGLTVPASMQPKAAAAESSGYLPPWETGDRTSVAPSTVAPAPVATSAATPEPALNSATNGVRETTGQKDKHRTRAARNRRERRYASGDLGLFLGRFFFGF